MVQTMNREGGLQERPAARWLKQGLVGFLAGVSFGTLFGAAAALIGMMFSIRIARLVGFAEYLGPNS